MSGHEPSIGFGRFHWPADGGQRVTVTIARRSERNRRRSGTVFDNPTRVGFGLVCLTVTGQTSLHSVDGGRSLEVVDSPDTARVSSATLAEGPLEIGGVPMPWFERTHRRVVIAAAVLLMGGLLVSCSDDDDPPVAEPPPTDNTTTTSSTTSTTTRPTTTEAATPTTAPGTTPEDEVIDRYIGFWNARLEANSGTPDPNHPGLREFATGAQLDAVIAETQSNLDEGLAFRPAADPQGFQHVTVIELNGDRAVVQECVVSDGVIYRRDSGEVVNDEVATHNVRGELARVDGRWRVASAQLIQRFEGVAGCALGS